VAQRAHHPQRARVEARVELLPCFIELDGERRDAQLEIMPERSQQSGFECEYQAFGARRAFVDSQAGLAALL
jgi:hypothetical protein